MRILLLPSSASLADQERQQFLTSYLVNDTIAIDAGSLGLFGSPAQQARIRHIFLSHSHLDHVAGLPVFLENIYPPPGGPVMLYGSAATLDSIRKDVFNPRVWVDLDFPGADRILKPQTLTAGQTVSCDGVRVTPFPVNHAVPTFAFLLEDERSAVVISSDTGPTEELWQRANAAPNLKAVFLEASFPNALADIAEQAGHLTPAMFAAQIAKLKRPARILAMHIKTRYYDQVVTELTALGLPDLQIARPGTTYEF